MAMALLLALLALAPEASTQSGFVTVPEGKLFYEVQGSGPALVLLHDGLMDSVTWQKQMAAFSPFFRTIRYDRRGYGRSQSESKAHSDVADLLAVLDELKATDAALVGCSSGSGLALDFALAHPKRVRALVLVGPVVSGFGFTDHMTRRDLVNMRPLYVNGDPAGALRNWAEDPWLTDARNVEARAMVREALTRSPVARPDASRPLPPEQPALPRLAEIRAPTLIMIGASDIPDVHAHAGAIAAGIREARRVVVESAGHLIHMEKPDEFDKTVLSFLRPAEEAAAWVAANRRDEVATSGTSLLAYDASAPLGTEERGVETRGAAQVHDIVYTSPKGGQVPAYLVVPSRPGRHAGVVFVHHGQGNRQVFLEEAVTLAGRGVVSLLIDAPEARPGARPGHRPDPSFDLAERVQGIIDVRRAFDLLASRADVDPQRLAYVGYSLGATLGATLAGVESRPKGFVMMAGFPSLVHANTEAIFFRELLDEPLRKSWVESMSQIDGVHYLGRSKASFLLQFATRDEYISRWDAAAYAEAISGKKAVEWYPTSHFALGDASREARLKWLAELLALAPPSS